MFCLKCVYIYIFNQNEKLFLSKFHVFYFSYKADPALLSNFKTFCRPQIKKICPPLVFTKDNCKVHLNGLLSSKGYLGSISITFMHYSMTPQLDVTSNC